MLMPAGMPPIFSELAKAESQQDLMVLLSHDGELLAQFFAAAIEDETWCLTNTQFTSWALSSLTKLALVRRLQQKNSLAVVKALQPFYENFESYIPINVVCEVSDGKYPISSLFFGTLSPFFEQAIYKNHVELGKEGFYLGNINSTIFEVIKEFIYHNDIQEIGRLQRPALETLITFASIFGIDGLGELCQNSLKHFVEPENVFELLFLAHQNHWLSLREYCKEVINSDDRHLQISFPDADTFKCQLDGVSEHNIDIFMRIAPYITHLELGDVVALSPVIKNLFISCPRLVSLDLGKTNRFVEELSFLPQTVTELKFTNCPWMNNDNLKRVVSLVPWIQCLDLANCTALTSVAWGALLKLSHLISLNLTTCNQIRDAELSIIADAATNLQELHLDACKNLNAEGFNSLSRSCKSLETLSLARTSVTDASLIDLISKLTALRTLDVSHCPHLTAEGFFEMVRLGRSLRQVDLSYCNLSLKETQKIVKEYPRITFVTTFESYYFE